MIYINIITGLVLVATFVGVIIYYYSPKNKNAVEAPKYAMLNDDDQVDHEKTEE